MSRTRRNFSAKFKSELVIELLKEEKDLNTIASENNIQPNLLCNWKKEFLDKASVCRIEVVKQSWNVWKESRLTVRNVFHLK